MHAGCPVYNDFKDRKICVLGTLSLPRSLINQRAMKVFTLLENHPNLHLRYKWSKGQLLDNQESGTRIRKVTNTDPPQLHLM